MIIFKQLVAADTKYTAQNQANCTIFDVHNDAPFNIGVSFGRDTGADNADYYSGPHSILTGIRPTSNAPAINMVKWNGTIFIYTETPLGTGNTNLATAPAFQVTIIGYPTGYQPQGTVSMSRMTATPNAVNTVGGTSSAIQNDANTAGTSIVEATVSGDSASAVSWTNNAILVNGDTLHPGTVSLDNAKITTDGSGNITAVSLTTTGGVTVDGTLVVDGTTSLDVAKITTDGAGNITSISFSGVWRSATAGQGLSNALNSVAAHISTYNANAIFPQSGATSTGLVLITRDSSGTAQTGLSIDPAASECEIWENIYISGTMTSTGKISTDGGNLTTDGSGNVTSGSITMNNATNPQLHFKGGAKVSSLNSFSGTGNGSFNTNLPNSSNVQIAFNPCTVSLSTQTIGGTAAQTSTVHTGAGLAWQGSAWQFV